MNIEQMLEKQKGLLEKYGWYSHYVFDSKGELDTMCNFHTHGLKENFNHMDLQIVLPINPQISHSVVSGIIELIKNGQVFKNGERSSDVLLEKDVLFKEYEEGGRTVLRVILPDENNILPPHEDLDEMYQKQLEVLTK